MLNIIPRCVFLNLQLNLIVILPNGANSLEFKKYWIGADSFKNRDYDRPNFTSKPLMTKGEGNAGLASVRLTLRR